MSVALYFSGTIHYMIFIFGTHVQNGHMSRHLYNFFKILIFQAGVKGQEMVQNDKKFWRTPGLRNQTWSSFLLRKCRMIMSPGVFFHFFKILIFLVVWRGKGQKLLKMTKNAVRCTLYLRNHISYNLHLWYTCVKGWYLYALIHFFKMLNFWFISGVNGQKNGPKWQKIMSARFHASGSIHHMIVILLHMCKIMTSLNAFSFFQSF